MGAEVGQAENRTTIHLHGGQVPWISDGAPYSWFDSRGGYGASAGSNGESYKVVNPSLAPGQAEYYYPNAQGARMMWYHDHAVGITRLNVYAGLASGYVITDDYENLTMTVGYKVPRPPRPKDKVPHLPRQDLRRHGRCHGDQRSHLVHHHAKLAGG
jgi:spore coat protein A